MRTVEQLKARRAILVGALERVRKGWARGMLAKDRNGARVEPNDPSAVCWCAAGALLVRCLRLVDFVIVPMPRLGIVVTEGFGIGTTLEATSKMT